MLDCLNKFCPSALEILNPCPASIIPLRAISLLAASALVATTAEPLFKSEEIRPTENFSFTSGTSESRAASSNTVASVPAVTPGTTTVIAIRTAALSDDFTHG
jgi:hypothetical protein